MSPFSRTRRLGAIALVAAAVACSRTDATPVAGKARASGGDVAANSVTARMPGTRLTDSLSAKADRGRIRGAESAPIWLVEISDFQCPYCKQWHDQTFAAIDREFVQTGSVRLAYLNYPIPSLHVNARAAAEAAMCASAQGKFWELHESLFNTQQKWAAETDPSRTFDSLAVAAGVNAPEWKSCVSGHGTIPLIDADHERSSASGVQSTPTFFVGDRKIEGAYPLDTFRTVILQQIRKAKGGH